LVVATFASGYGPISGCHVNPAVTVSVLVAKQISSRDAGLYIVVQLLGGILGALFLRFVLTGAETGLGATVLAQNLRIGEVSLSVTPLAGLVLETILTFFLANAVLNTAIAGRGGDVAPLAIGLTLTFCILMGGPLTGASLNPARTIGPAIASGTFTDTPVRREASGQAANPFADRRHRRGPRHRLPGPHRDGTTERRPQPQHAAGGDPFLLPVRGDERTRLSASLPARSDDAQQAP
jgi:glycerol uptake facilitator-like aquaporin